MADRDEHYRGYGRPSGRYYEAREYEAGRDRDGRGGRMGGGGRDDDRGFFEEAGDKIRSWFGDDDDRGSRYSRDEREGRGRDHERSRDFGLGGTMSGGAGRGNHDRDDRPPQTSRAEPTSGGYDYRRDEWRGATSDRGAGSARNQYSGGGDRHPHDDHYQEWRQQQLAELDRDYHEYRSENREKFHSEFSNWRGQRQQQRASIRQVREHMEVVGSDGQPVGTVDKVAGDRIILTKNGPMAGGHHHSIPCGWLQSVDQERVTINKTAEQAREKWTDEENRRALFERDGQGQDGPHILDRSFSGTYER